MKKIWLAAGILTLGLAGVLGFKATGFAASAVTPAPVTDGGYENVSQDAERNRELLEIWKDHVRTLTKERDSAYKELETLKAQQSSGNNTAHFGGVEMMPLPTASGEPMNTTAPRSIVPAGIIPSGANDQEIEGYKSSLRDLQAQVKTLLEQNKQIQKELSESRGDKDILIRDKETALRQVDKLSKEIQSSKNQDADPTGSPSFMKLLTEKNQADTRIQSLVSEVETLQNSSSRFQSQLDSLQVENDRLKTEQSSNAAVEPSVQTPAQIDPELQKQLKASQEKIEDLKSEKEETARQARELKYQNDTFQAKLEKMKVVEKELGDTRAYLTPVIKDLQDKNEHLKSENEGLRRTTAKMGTLETDRDTLNRSLSDQNGTLKQQQSDLQEASKENERLRKDNDKLSAQNETLEAARDSLQSDKSSQNESLKQATDELARTEEALERYKSQLKKLDVENHEIKAAQAEKIGGFLSQQEDASDQIAGLKAKLQISQADAEKAKVSETGLQKAIAENEGLKSSIQKLESQLKSQDTRFGDLSSEVSSLRKTNVSLQKEQSEQKKTIEGLRAALKANLSDMQNLKTNFESYLESLVSGFDERQKQQQPAQETPGS